MPQPIQFNNAKTDNSARFKSNTTVVASPAAGSETIICSLPITDDIIVTTGIILEGWAAFTVGTNGVSANLKIRQTNVSGTTIAATGACTVTAANLVHFSVQGIDTEGVLPGQVYVLTLTVGSGSAASTVSATQLLATIV